MVVCGGTLGLFLATALQLRGWRVAVVEKRLAQGRNQEWNISWGELQVGKGWGRGEGAYGRVCCGLEKRERGPQPGVQLEAWQPTSGRSTAHRSGASSAAPAAATMPAPHCAALCWWWWDCGRCAPGRQCQRICVGFVSAKVPVRPLGVTATVRRCLIGLAVPQRTFHGYRLLLPSLICATLGLGLALLPDTTIVHVFLHVHHLALRFLPPFHTQVLEELGLLSHEALRSAVVSEFNPIRVGFLGGQDMWVRDVLNLGVQPRRLLEAVRARFLEAGGVIHENTAFKGAVVHPVREVQGRALGWGRLATGRGRGVRGVNGGC